MTVTALELFYDWLAEPARAAALIDERRPLALGVLAFILGAVGLFVAQAVAQRHAVLAFSYSACFFVVIGRLAAGFVVASVIHLILELGGARGRASSLFVQFGLADLGWALAVPAVLLVRLASPDSSWPATLIFFAAWLLTLGLKARGVKESYGVSIGRAWGAVVIPYIAVGVFALILLSLAVVGVAMQLFKALG